MAASSFAPAVLTLLSVAGSGWESIARIRSCDAGEFRKLAAPMATAARLTYTSTEGSSYYKPEDLNATVEGFTRSALKHDPRTGGMRALVFVDERTQRVLVAFRGTDLDNSTVGGQADECAGALLFRGRAAHELPPFCDEFSAHVLDYYARALEFTLTVMREYPDADLLCTGHSLGAGLAVLVAAAVGKAQHKPVPVVAIAEPPTSAALRSRVHIESMPPDTAFILAYSADPVHRAAVAEGFVGEPCVWGAAQPLPPACEKCDYVRHSRTPACSECILEAHTLKHYLQLLQRDERPQCEPPAFSHRVHPAVGAGAARADGLATHG